MTDKCMPENDHLRKKFDLGRLLPAVIESHEHAWLYGNWEAAEGFVGVLSEIHQLAKDLELPDSLEDCQILYHEWAQIFRRRHQDWFQIYDTLNRQLDAGADERISVGMLLAGVPWPVSPPDEEARFQSSPTDDLLQRVREGLEEVSTPEGRFTWRQAIKVFASIAPALFHPNAGDAERRRLQSRMYSYYCRMSKLLRVDNTSSFSSLKDPMPTCIFSSSHALARAVLLKSPFWGTLSSMLWNVADELQGQDGAALFSLGLHTSLLRSCPRFIPSCMHAHPLLLASKAHAFFTVVSLSENDARKILHLIRDEVERTGLSGEVERLATEGPADYEITTLTSWGEELLLALERDFALR